MIRFSPFQKNANIFQFSNQQILYHFFTKFFQFISTAHQLYRKQEKRYSVRKYLSNLYNKRNEDKNFRKNFF